MARTTHYGPIPDDAIRARAYHIWQREGCPDGRAADHWQMARTELAMEMSPELATRPTPTADGSESNPYPEPVEPEEAVENQGSSPALADQDEEGYGLGRRTGELS